jgi:thymidylate synthase (FAD)
VWPAPFSEEPWHYQYYDAVAASFDAYEELLAAGVPKEDARLVLPNAAMTRMVMSANFRQWRHIIKVRCTPAAQWEIRRVCERVRDILTEHAPAVFGDLGEEVGCETLE